MKRHLAIALSVAVVAAGASVASDAAYTPKFNAECFAPVSAFRAGLPAVAGAEKMSAQDKIGKLTDKFSGVVEAVQKAQSCYQGALKASAGAADHVADIQAGAKEVGRIFRLNYEQYQSAMEPLTAAAMGEIAPAAGGDGDQVGMDSAMQAVTNSMFVDEWAKKALDGQKALEESANKPE
ncbi:hypothetical protein [Kordiimonas marina]|uniref:hypothetical protein n=1 Tax=Kordiimonas marina TaxID=2872312 RepID=UPI001FF52609|nr:hypothetical protein [Kordiimonas marina]MCJ9430213.1 hypothetical protein [Kordiimonas marina]